VSGARVAVAAGGPSSEREVSLRSGAAVAAALRTAGYDVVETDPAAGRLDLPSGVRGVFLALHGRYGEDGTVQAELEARGVPYTGSDPAASRICFSKRLTRERLAAAGLPVAPGATLTAPAPVAPLPLPVVVKPSREGSSIGCHRVFHEAEWYPALTDALRRDDEAVVERYIPGRELTVGIVGDRALPAVEVRAPDGYYDYTAKYTAGRTEYLVPAPLTPAEAARAAELAGATFRTLGARDLGRVDFRLTPEGEWFILELNNLPGFTATSLLPKAAAAAGIPFPALCARIMEMALARG